MLKLIVWDLDDTLWRGTLADDDQVDPYEHRIELVRAFNARGVLSSICSKNDPAIAEAKLRALGWWDEFVFPCIDFAPKPSGISGIIADMQLRAPDVLFVDDNVQNLEAVRFHLPDVQLLDITQSDADDHLHALLQQQHGSSRLATYRQMEQRHRDRTGRSDLSHEEFLRSCDIQAAGSFCMESLEYLDRLVELMARSNQLNHTKSRRTAEELRAEIIDVLAHPSLAIFAWDRYGDYGLVGFVMLRHVQGTFTVVHSVFSCRVMHMGLERAAIDHLKERSKGMYPPIRRIEWGNVPAKFDETPVDWVTIQPYSDPAVRAKMAESGLKPNAAAIQRIMFGCQSAGLTHFSSFEHDTVFDSYPDIFTLLTFFDGSYDTGHLPSHIVYGVGAEYLNSPWGRLGNALEYGLYEECVERFCKFFTSQGKNLLIVLPPEQFPSHYYHPGMGLSRERTVRFNALWRRAFQLYPGISTLDSDLAHDPSEMIDVNHYTPVGLKTLAGIIDSWREQVDLRIASQHHADSANEDATADAMETAIAA